MRRPLRCAFSLGLVALGFGAIALPEPVADARPHHEPTGCKGDCRKTERRCDGDCVKTNAGCADQCGCPIDHRCTEAQKMCMGVCNARMNACMASCHGVYSRCARKC